jgi:hypothetical protein
MNGAYWLVFLRQDGLSVVIWQAPKGVKRQ